MRQRWITTALIALAASLLVWSIAHTRIEYQVAVEVSRERYFRQRQELIDEMMRLGRSAEEMQRILDNYDRRYGNAQNHEDR